MNPQKKIPSDLEYEQSPFKIDYSLKNLLRMNLNENVVLPRNLVRSALEKCAGRLDSRFYPSDLCEGEMAELTAEISKYCNCSDRMISLGDGSDQLIDLLCRMRLKSRSDALVTVDPTFSMYSLMARRCGAKVIEVPLMPSTSQEQAFSLKREELLAACNSKEAKLLVIASPNNPTAIQYPLEEIRAILESLPNVTVLIDEAYVEFGNYSLTKFLSSYPNLVILRTFSKAFGLASHRLGFLICGDDEFVERLNSEYQYPYPITALAAMVATELLRKKSEILRYVEKTKDLRGKLIRSLEELSPKIRTFPVSDTNFVIVQSNEARKIAAELLSKYRIALKYLPELGLEKDFLRISVGTSGMNERLLRSLGRIVGS